MRRYTARYRRASIKRWTEPTFRELSSKPSAKLLLLFLEQGPHTTSLPGLFSAGPKALAESIGWTSDEFIVSFSELEASGFARADWRAPLVWLPRYTMQDFNAPDNINVFKSWCSNFDELPECELKDQAAVAIHNFLDILTKGDAVTAVSSSEDTEQRKKAQAQVLARRRMPAMWFSRLPDCPLQPDDRMFGASAPVHDDSEVPF